MRFMMYFRILLFLLFPFLSYTQTFTKDRFIAHNKMIMWVEKYEIKDMDTPIIIETMTDNLKRSPYIRLDSLQKDNTLEGWLIKPPFTALSKAKFRIDFLYESYFATVSSMIEQKDSLLIPLEKTILQQNGHFIDKFPDAIEEMDSSLATFFMIKH